MKNYNLRYNVKRIALKDVPYKESRWWFATERTKCFVLFPEKYPQKKAFAGVDSH